MDKTNVSAAAPAVALPTTTPAGHRWQRELRFADEHLAAAFRGEEPLLLDGGMGTQLQARGLAAGETPELLCLSNPAEITEIHAAYVAAGSEAVTTNTFGANRIKLAAAPVTAKPPGSEARFEAAAPSVDQIFAAAIACARAAGPRYVAADIGPTGALLKPLGTMGFDEAYDLFAEQALAAERHGADLVIIETMADLAEMKAALLAVRENTSLPVICTMTFGEDGRTFLGTTPEVAATALSALGANAVGINCSLGPADIAPLVQRMIAWSRVPVVAQANAGLPQLHDGVTSYSIGPEEYVAALEGMVAGGVSIIGGCCGTTPGHIAEERGLIARVGSAMKAQLPGELPFTVASAQRLMSLPMGHVGVIGERINPTGKKRLKEALRSGNLDYVLREAISQDEAGAQILDINAGLPEIDERVMLGRLVNEVSGVTTLPLQVDSADADAVEAVVRPYAGKPMINSVNGKRESLEAIVPIAKHYGCALVGLCIDEGGIPETAEGRLAVARRIVATTDAAGIPREDVAIDCLTMAVSTNQLAGRAILDAIRLVKAELPGVRTVLGVSNISFGLPYRPLLNATFLTAAFSVGLDLAIINPLDERLADAVAAWRVFNGEDDHENSYVQVYAERAAREKEAAKAAAAPAVPDGVWLHFSDDSWRQFGQAAGTTAPPEAGAAPFAAEAGAAAPAASAADALSGAEPAVRELHDLVLAGRSGPVPEVVRTLLATHDAMFVIDEVLIPALDEVGGKFEAGTFFLPQLMASAEAAKAGFEEIRASSDNADVASKGKIALATVKGDIHDIGKNIVRMLLENYGYEVVDLGRDVDPQAFVDTVVEQNIRLAGLSALMTTTVPAMGETIKLLREQAPWCKVIVGGAVLNPEYAEMVGADFYAKDANESARIAGEVLG